MIIIIVSEREYTRARRNTKRDCAMAETQICTHALRPQRPTQARVHTHTDTRAHALHKHAHTCKNKLTHTYTHTHKHMQARVQKIHTHTHTHACTHTHTHIIIIINPLTARVVGAPQMILQPVFSIFPCSPLPSGTCRTPGLSIP